MAVEVQHSDSQVKSAEEFRQAADEHAQTLKDFWKRFFVSGLFVLAAIAIILACLAWFAANNRVDATSSTLSAKAGHYTLVADGEGEPGAQTGYYEQHEQQSLSGLDTTDAMTITLGSNLNNYYAGGIYPGACGQISFTVQPLVNNLNGVTIALSRIVKSKDGKVSADKDFDPTLDDLMRGHLLLFKNKSGDFYSDRVVDDVIEIPKKDFCTNYDEKNESGITDKSVRITLYWVWPEYFQNFVYTGNTNYYKNLFVDANGDYANLQQDVNKNKTIYFYGSSNETVAAYAPEVSSDMSSDNLAICADLYNQADEYLGDNAAYLQLRISAREGVS